VSEVNAVREFFNQVAGALTHALGTPAALFIAIGVIVAWLLTGPAFGFSDTWQLLINTGTTIVTFLMVFVIQNAQNRDSKAVHAKLDELLRAQQGAREEFVIAEVEPEEQLDRQIAELRALAASSPHLKPLLATRLRELPIEPGGEGEPDRRAADEPTER
jgi:low affinity Fe/Cu permease